MRRAIGLAAMRRGVGIAVLVSALWAAPAFAAPAPPLPLSHEGLWITDARGRAVILHGVNMVYKRPPYTPGAIGFNRPDARFLRRHGFNNVRIGVIYAGVEPAPGDYDNGYIRRIERTQRMLGRQRIFTLLDFHQDQYNEKFEGEGWPDWAVIDDGLPAEPTPGFGPTYFVSPGLNQAFNSFWLNRAGPGGVGLQDRYAAAWRRVANRFRRAPWVMGYDLINEPWPGSQWPSCVNPGGCPAFEQQFLGPAQGKAMEAIRAVDGRHLIWYEPVVTTQSGPEFWVPNPTADPMAGMSFHAYCVAAVLSFFPQFANTSCDQLDPITIANGVEHAEANGDAMLLSEFGATTNAVTIKRVVDLADEHLLSWQWWHYCGCDDPTTAGPGDTQAIVGDPRESPRGDNVFRDKLRLLERPYPQAVNGTPTSFVFDRETRTFELEYGRRAPGGGRLSRRVLTHVFVPRIHYPDGYEVEARGARVVSRPNARVLKLKTRTRRGAREVQVTVRPAQ